MATQATLQAEPRTIMGKAVRHLRQQGLLPANLTGNSMTPLALQVRGSDVDRMLKAFGRTTVIQLTIASLAAPRTAMLGSVQRDPISGAIKHIDFIQVDLTQKMRASITLHVVGESPAVKNNAGILLQLMNQIEVEALPDDLPKDIEIEITGLVNVDDAVYVRDLSLPAGVVVFADSGDAIVRVAQTRGSLEVAAKPVEAVVSSAQTP
ncbi:MAG TPA: 50S ribosomal protein L25 [Ktedonobacterales bacterium]|nr:50S ribosomal protein L25 [Ktedonobacterales bacterium]